MLNSSPSQQKYSERFFFLKFSANYKGTEHQRTCLSFHPFPPFSSVYVAYWGFTYCRTGREKGAQLLEDCLVREGPFLPKPTPRLACCVYGFICNSLFLGISSTKVSPPPKHSSVYIGFHCIEYQNNHLSQKCPYPRQYGEVAQGMQLFHSHHGPTYTHLSSPSFLQLLYWSILMLFI